MGSIIQSKCSCGFESDDLIVGSGMRDMDDKCNVPYYCEHCEIVDTINIIKKNSNDFSSPVVKKDITCKKCRKKVQYYGEIVEDTFEDNEDYIFDWGIIDYKKYILHDKLYYCPKCRKVNMNFYFSLCWD